MVRRRQGPRTDFGSSAVAGVVDLGPDFFLYPLGDGLRVIVQLFGYGRPFLDQAQECLDLVGRILDAELNELPVGEVGSIYVRNSTQFDGYTSGQTKAFHEGFMCSGDVGYVDDAGRLFVVGRDDEMIVSGGENVYPIEVEKTLAAHDDVAEAAVLGVDDEKFGQRLEAFVVLRPGAAATPDELKQHVREHLANFKVPRAITVLDELPRGTTGKISRKELQDRAKNA